jgi:hypothetical protein
MRSYLIASVIIAGLPMSVHADGRAEIRAKCEADVKANCGLVMSRSAALSCLIENAGKLSGGCSTALHKASCSDEAPANVKAAFACKN